MLRLRPIVPGSDVASASAFGIARRANGAVVACSVVPGVLHTALRSPDQEQLRLVTLGPDGRALGDEDGPLGHGIWFQAAPGDAAYAIAVRGNGAARVVVVNRWGTPGRGDAGWPLGGNEVLERTFAQAVLAGAFAAGVGLNGSLYLVAGSNKLAVLEIRPDGTHERLVPSGRSTTGLRLLTGVHRVLFPGPDRMLVTCRGAKGERKVPPALVRGFEVGAGTVEVDAGWGVKGAWSGPPRFTPADLLADSQGNLVCAGWMSASATAASFTVLHISGDGTSDDRSTAPPGPTVPEAVPVRTELDAADGLLVASTIPNPFGVFLPGLPAWALVTRRSPDGQADTAFGTQGVCVAEHHGYPTGARALAVTPSGFLLACDRAADILRGDTLPVVFSFTDAGQARPEFGDVGIVHHEEVPSDVQVHDATETVAAGLNRISRTPLPDEFELAVTRLWANGRVRWQYGTTHGLRSAALFVGGQRANYFRVQTTARWRGLVAIGGSAAAPISAGFVTFRDQNGAPYPAVPGTTLAFGEQVVSLVAAANGALDVFYRVGSPSVLMKASVTAALTVDPAGPVVVPAPPAGLLLADGSRVETRTSLIAGGPNPFLLVWLVRRLADGTIDPMFGGGNADPPAATRRITRTDATSRDSIDLPGGVLALPGGGFALIVRRRRLFPPDTVSIPIGIVATRWDAAGMPDASWPPEGAPFSDFVVVKDVLVDHPARVVVIGAVETAGTGSRTPALLGLRVSDGAPDPTFGTQGRLVVPVRGPEARVAQRLLTRPDGTTIVPVKTDDEFRLPEQRSLIWLDVR